MKILHIIETLNTGGAERLLVTMLPELVRQGHEVHVAVMRPPTPLKSELEAGGIPVHVLPRRGKWHVLRQAGDLARLARSLQTDVVHAHLYFPILVTAMARSLGWLGAVTHASFHNLAYIGANRKTWKLAARRHLAGFFVRRGIEQPQAVSAATAAHFSDAFGLKTIVVLHNAFDPACTQTLQITRGAAIVLPGRLVPEKGHGDLISAIRMLGPDCPPVVFAGDGALRQQLEVEIAEGQLPISITGALSHPDMLRTIASARLVVIPSRFEGFGLTALEALALGKAVVATDVGGLPEVMGELGCKVPAADPVALAETLRRVLADDTWQDEQAQRGPSQAAKFAVATIAQQQITLYKDAIRRKV